MSRRAKTRTSLLSVVVLALVAIVFWRASTTSAVAATASPATSPDDFGTTLYRVGLDPRSLAAAGVSSNSVTGIVAAVEGAIQGDPSGLSGADTAFAEARVAHDALERKIRSGKASQEEVAAYPSAKSALETATAAQQAELDALFTAGTASLGESPRAALAQLRGNRTWGLPPEFLVVERTQQQWVSLRDALANERFSAEYNETPNSDAAALLATARSNAAVATAITGLSTNLASITSAWNAAASD